MDFGAGQAGRFPLWHPLADIGGAEVLERLDVQRREDRAGVAGVGTRPDVPDKGAAPKVGNPPRQLAGRLEASALVLGYGIGPDLNL